MTVTLVVGESLVTTFSRMTLVAPPLAPDEAPVVAPLAPVAAPVPLPVAAPVLPPVDAPVVAAPDAVPVLAIEPLAPEGPTAVPLCDAVPLAAFVPVVALVPEAAMVPLADVPVVAPELPTTVVPLVDVVPVPPPVVPDVELPEFCAAEPDDPPELPELHAESTAARAAIEARVRADFMDASLLWSARPI
jgi:hypothetical protein